MTRSECWCQNPTLLYPGLVWGMFDQRSYPSLLLPVSTFSAIYIFHLVYHFLSLTSFAFFCPRSRHCAFPLIVGFFILPYLSALFSPVFFSHLVSPLLLPPTSNFLSWISYWRCRTAFSSPPLLNWSPVSPWWERDCFFFWMSGCKHGRCFLMSVLVLLNMAIPYTEREYGKDPQELGWCI